MTAVIHTLSVFRVVTNPVVDYGSGAIVAALTYAGHTWGLGRRWARLPFVPRSRWLI